MKNVIQTVPFLSCLTGEEAAVIDRIIRRRRFRKNQIILVEEDSPDYLYIIYSGKVKVVQSSGDGRENILVTHKQGDFFGEMAMLDRKTAPATVIAIEDSLIGLMSREDFEKYLLPNAKVQRAFLSLLCSRLRDAWLTVKVLHHASAEDRVREVLKLLSLQEGVKDERGMIIPLKLTHEEIAGYASLRRETVTRLLGKLVRDKEIEFIKDRHILLKPSFAKRESLL